MFKWNFPYFKVCPLLLVLPLGITEKHLISLPLLPSSGIYSLSYLRCLNPFTVLHWTHSSISMPPFYWGVQNRSQHSQSAPPVLNRGEGLSPHQLTALSPAAPVALVARVHCWLVLTFLHHAWCILAQPYLYLMSNQSVPNHLPGTGTQIFLSHRGCSRLEVTLELGSS